MGFLKRIERALTFTSPCWETVGSPIAIRVSDLVCFGQGDFLAPWGFFLAGMGVEDGEQLFRATANGLRRVYFCRSGQAGRQGTV